MQVGSSMRWIDRERERNIESKFQETLRYVWNWWVRSDPIWCDPLGPLPMSLRNLKFGIKRRQRQRWRPWCWRVLLFGSLAPQVLLGWRKSAELFMRSKKLKLISCSSLSLSIHFIHFHSSNYWDSWKSINKWNEWIDLEYLTWPEPRVSTSLFVLVSVVCLFAFISD